MIHYVTDTHPLVWYFLDDESLSSNALNAFQRSEREGIIIVPAVVLAEVMFIAKKGRIALSFEETLRLIEESENFEVAPLDVAILKIADKIEADLEMHDRIIVATALHYEATLITKDERIILSGIVPTLW